MSQLTEIDENPPEWLDKDAIKEWHRILPLIQELPIAALDMGLLATYCQTYSNYKNATIQLEKKVWSSKPKEERNCPVITLYKGTA